MSETLLAETLLAETLGEDTTTQLYRDSSGAFRMRVMALPEDGGEQVPPSRSPHIFDDRPISAEDAQSIFGGPGATRYVEAL